MICKKESEVEVLEQGEEHLGSSWRPAKIVSGNGHNYVVKFDSCSMETHLLTNKVPRKALRPRPPRVEVKIWACADLVEVYDDGSWKLAEVLRNLDMKMVVARLLGSSKEIVTPFLKLRFPQTWTDNQWIPWQKESVKCKNADEEVNLKRWRLSSQIPKVSAVEKKRKQNDRCAEDYGDSVDQWFQESLGRLKKKSRESNPPVYPHAGAFGMKKQIKKNGRCYELNEKNLANHPFEKVDVVNSPKNFYGEQHMNSAFYRETIGFGQIGLYCNNPIADAGPNLVVSLDHLDNESPASSVGSCSVINGLSRPRHLKTSQRKKPCDHIDDAESFCGSPTDPNNFREDEMARAIRLLELDAYRSTLRSLYASGSLSWDQESLLTNLRRALHISNDEHRSELKVSGLRLEALKACHWFKIVASTSTEYM